MLQPINVAATRLPAATQILGLRVNLTKPRFALSNNVRSVAAGHDQLVAIVELFTQFLALAYDDVGMLFHFCFHTNSIHTQHQGLTRTMLSMSLQRTDACEPGATLARDASQSDPVIQDLNS